MKIYEDVFTRDEMCSDTYPMKVVDDVILEFTAKHITRKEGDIVIDGANPSAEDENFDEGTDPTSVSGLDIVLNQQLQEMTTVYSDAKAFKEYIKEYMSKLAKRLAADGKSEEEVKAWKGKMQKWVVELLKKDRFKHLQFFAGAGESADEGQLAILEYRDFDDGERPIFMFIKDGLEEIKT